MSETDLHELVASCNVRTRWNAAEHVEYLGGASAAKYGVGMSQDDAETDSKKNDAALGEQTVPYTQHRLSTYTTHAQPRIHTHAHTHTPSNE